MKTTITDTPDLVQYLHPELLHEIRITSPLGSSATSTEVIHMTTKDLRELWNQATDRLGIIR